MSARRLRWVWIAGVAFVTLALAAQVAIPLLVQRRVAQHRDTMDLAEPARTLLMGLQFSIVREMATLNQYSLTGDTAAASRFLEARAVEAESWNELAKLTRNLGTDVHEHFVESRAIAHMWHERLDEDEVMRRRRAGLSTLPTDDARRHFEEVLRATARLDSTIVRVTRAHRERTEAAERSGLLLMFTSGALALLAAAVVGALVLHMRRLAVEAETRRRETADALAASADAAEARRRLLRGITHDVKNPLGTARGYAELLEMGFKGDINDEQMKLVHGVERSIDSALAIISDLLDLARADSDAVVVQRIDTDLNFIAREAVADHRATAETAGHSISVQPGADTLTSFTDPLRVRQVLDNLLSNAIKYTPPPGRIIVSTDPNADDAPFPGRAVALRVSDTGPGIPPDQRERIFDEFARLDEHTSTRGHGLGLAIARRLARLLGGELAIAQSGPNGSTFALWLPQRELRERERDAPATAA